MIPFSVLDLAPITQGGDAGQALRNSLDLARNAERLGYRRFWLAEHHNMPGIASAATAVVICHVASGTTSIRVGAGGIMLPNHAPLVIAEQFGTLAALFPGRVDLGLGRAPGTDQVTMRALRRSLDGDVDNFPDDVVELLDYFEARPDRRVNAVPAAGEQIEAWMLGSSLYGAQLAAHLGLPYAFASHFAPAQLMRALEVYRSRFRPSRRLARPYAMVGCNIIAADSDAEAQRLLTSLQQAFVALRSGRAGPLPPPVDDIDARIGVPERALLADVLACSFVGAPATVRDGLAEFLARTGADELMVTAQIYDHAARVRSYEIAAAVRDELGRERAVRAS
jgi:luciferase family oxidoreductase group 1